MFKFLRARFKWASVRNKLADAVKREYQRLVRENPDEVWYGFAIAIRDYWDAIDAIAYGERRFARAVEDARSNPDEQNPEWYRHEPTLASMRWAYHEDPALCVRRGSVRADQRLDRRPVQRLGMGGL